jgi:succinate dehydrogenase/fumarate reductase flavoprotein subunit
MSDILDCDLLVIGAGMAGLSAAARAAERGGRVIVVEKAPDIGGSAILSGGYVWTVASRRELAACDDGDPALGAVVIDGYGDAIAWLRSRGVETSPPTRVLHGRGYQVDLIAHLRACAATVKASGGHVVTRTQVERLTTDTVGAVTGAETQHEDGDIRVRAAATLLATGGYQASAALRRRHINPQADEILLRSNPCSEGDGLRLAEAVGAVHAGPNPGFYGHLLSYPAKLDDATYFTRLSQYHSDYSLLLDRQGRRFCDESRGDHLNCQETAFLPGGKALLFWDEGVHQRHVMVPFVAGAAAHDRLATALTQGAQGACCNTLDEAGAFATKWGFDGAAAMASVRAFNEAVRSAPERLRPARTGETIPLDRPPFRIMVVQPAITFTHGGIAIASMARALDSLGRPVPGLLVAGADAGNIFRRGYAGGLALALTYGLRAAATAGFA